MAVVAGLALLGWLGLMPSRGGLVEQIQVEAMRLPKNTFVLLRLWLFGLGLLRLSMAVAYVANAIQTCTTLPIEAVEQLLTGYALTALQTSDYIRRTNPTTPSNGGRWTV